MFSPDGKHLAFGAKQNGKMFCFVDGKPGGPYEMAGHPCFSPDGRRLIHYAYANGRNFVVDDSKDGPAFDGIATASFTFSADGKRLAYVAKTGQKTRVVLDHEPGPEFDGITQGNIAFLPRNEGFAYIARNGLEHSLVVNHRIVRTHTNVAEGSLRITGDGKVAYTGEEKWGVARLWVGENSFPSAAPLVNWKPGYVLTGETQARYLSWRDNAFWIDQVEWA